MKLNFHSDPSHGWLEIPMFMIKDLGIGEHISEYSYMSVNGRIVYLEEDVDAALFLDAVKEKVTFNEIHTDYSSPIRRLPRYEWKN